MVTYRLVIADDHYAFRGVLKILLEKRKDLEVFGEASTGCKLVDLLSSSGLPPDLIVLHISMSDTTGLEAAPSSKRDSRGKILILSHHGQREVVDEALSIGVDGYLTNDDFVTDLFSAIDTIRQGWQVSFKISGPSVKTANRCLRGGTGYGQKELDDKGNHTCNYRFFSSSSRNSWKQLDVGFLFDQ